MLTSRNRGRCSSLSVAAALRPSRSPHAAATVAMAQKQQGGSLSDALKGHPLAARAVALLPPLLPACGALESFAVPAVALLAPLYPGQKLLVSTEPKRQQQETSRESVEEDHTMTFDKRTKMFTTCKKEATPKKKWLKFVKDTSLQPDAHYIATR